MTTLLFLFLIALGFALVLTPLAKRLGCAWGRWTFHRSGRSTRRRDVREHADETVRIWARGYYRRESDGRRPEGMLKIDLPLDSDGARLLLVKDINRDPLSYYTLRRLEHLRRTLLTNLARLQK